MNPRFASDTPGFTQTYTDINGLEVKAQPFKIGADRNSSVIDGVDHAHTGLAVKINLVVDPEPLHAFPFVAQ